MDGSDISFTMTGRTWATIRRHHPDLVNRLVVRGAVFARMAPEQKAQLIEVLQDIGRSLDWRPAWSLGRLLYPSYVILAWV